MTTPRLDLDGGRRLQAAGVLVLLLVLPASARGFDAVFSRDGLDVVAVGDSGVVLRSLDGGETWWEKTLGPPAMHGVAAAGSAIWTVGDGGLIRRSTDGGGSWTEQVAAGGADLHAIARVDAANLCAVGAMGTIVQTTDGGDSWGVREAPTAERLRAVRFHGPVLGWAVGDAGTVLRTLDGGAAWDAVDVPTVADLYGVDFEDAEVWVGGRGSAAFRSQNFGGSWTPIALGVAPGTTVHRIRLAHGSVTLAGGGGFIRRSDDGGATWRFASHPLFDAIYAVHWSDDGQRAWACGQRSRAILRSDDGGMTWALPPGTTTAHTWQLQLPVVLGNTRGGTLGRHGTNPATVYCALGPNVYHSPDRGETWTLAGTIPGCTRSHALVVSPLDSTQMLAVVDGPDRVVRSIDGGTKWTTQLIVDYTEYGVPLALDPDSPSRVLFAPEDGQLYESLDFGATFDVLSDPVFLSPCDVEIVPGGNGVIYVGDGLTGFGNAKLRRSSNGGLSFEIAYSSSGSEIPMIAVPPLDPAVGFATNWSSGGVRKTTNFGVEWTPILDLVAAWGTAFASDDPNVAIVGAFGGGLSYCTVDQGATFVSTSLPGANYSFLVPDRATFLAQQTTGIWKLRPRYDVPLVTAQSLELLAPSGGETLSPGQAIAVAWSSSAVVLVRVEYQESPAQPWQTVAVVEAARGGRPWSVPVAATNTARLRVSDAWDGAPVDSTTTFTIRVTSDANVDASSGPELWYAGNDPATGDALLRYRLGRAARVQLDVFDARGRRLAQLVDAVRPAGDHVARFAGDRRSVPAGVFFARLRAAGATRTAKIVALH